MQAGVRFAYRPQAATCTVEASALASGYGRAVAPGCIGVGEFLALRAVLVDVPHSVGERRKIGSVDCHVLADARKLGLQGRGDAVETVGQHARVQPEFRGEAVAGPHTRHTTKSGLQPRVISDQGRNSRPGRQAVESFDKAGSDHGASAISLLTPGIASHVDLPDQGGYFGRVQKGGNLRTDPPDALPCQMPLEVTLLWSRPRKCQLRGG
jgi:hypothetical protein